MNGIRITDFIEPEAPSTFDKLLSVFQQLILHTGGDVDEALRWMHELDRTYKLSNDDYGMADFINDLKDKGYLLEVGPDELKAAAKLDQKIRMDAFESIFGMMRKARKGNHRTNHSGQGDEESDEMRAYAFGDSLHHISMTDTLRNAQVNHGIGDFSIEEKDIVLYDTYHQAQMSTVLMIDISHSMILYGEDRITPAKMVAMALAELIQTKYPKDSLDVIVFGNDAWPISIAEIPYLQVGPYHTNTVAGLQLAMELLRKRKGGNKQIFMITDGKPTCLKEGDKYYKNSNGLDRRIVNRTLNLAAQCLRQRISITTFMVATDPWLQKFVEEFTEVNKGKAYFTGLQGLGDMVLRDFQRNRTKRI